MTRKTFDTGFNRPAPTPEEVGAIGSNLAIQRGIRDGLSSKIASDVHHQLAASSSLADGIVERLVSAIDDDIGDGTLLGGYIANRATSQVVSSMLPALETSLSLGMEGAELPSVALRAKPKGRRKRVPKGPREDNPPGPQYDIVQPQDYPPGDPPGPANPASQTPMQLAGALVATGLTLQQICSLNPAINQVIFNGGPDRNFTPFHTRLFVDPVTFVFPFLYIPLDNGQPINAVVAAGEQLTNGLLPIPDGWSDVVDLIYNTGTVPQLSCAGNVVVTQPPGIPPEPAPQPPGGKLIPGPPVVIGPPQQPKPGGGLLPTGQFPAPPQQPGGGGILVTAGAPVLINQPQGGGVIVTAPVAPVIPPILAPIFPISPPTPIGKLLPGGGGLPPVGSPPGQLLPVTPPSPPGSPPGQLLPISPPGPGGTLQPIGPISPPGSPPGQLLPIGPPVGSPPTVPPITTSPPTYPVQPYPPSPPPVYPPGGTSPYPPTYPVNPEPVNPVLPYPPGQPPSPIAPSPPTYPQPPVSPPCPPATVTCPGCSQPIIVPPAVVNLSCPACNCPITTSYPVSPVSPPVSPPTPIIKPPIPPVPSYPGAPPISNEQWETIYNDAYNYITTSSTTGNGGGGGSAFEFNLPLGLQEVPEEVESAEILDPEVGKCLPGPEWAKLLGSNTLLQVLQKSGAVDGSGHWQWAQAAWQALANDKTFWADFQRANLNAADAITIGVVNLVDWIGNFARQVGLCESDTATGAYVVQLLQGVWKRWIGDLPEQTARNWQYYLNYQCPTELPSQEWANDARSRGFVTAEEYACLTRANGSAFKYQFIDVNMRANRPTSDDLLSLLRRKLLSVEDYRARMEAIGWSRGDDRNTWEQAQEWVASPSDAIEWMLKDVADPQIQNTFGLGQEFALKYSGIVKDVFDANGMSQENANAMWRAHWRNMSPHTLYEMHKRLRPDRYANMNDADALAFAHAIVPRKPVGPGAEQEIADRDAFWGNVPHWLDTIKTGNDARAFLNALATTGFHLYEALGQADYPPFWRDRLLAISYNVLTRVDMRRAYETGVIGDVELVTLLQDRGYTPVDSGRLASFFRIAQIQLSSRRPSANQWVSQGYSVSLLRQSLVDTGMREDQWPQVQAILNTRRKIYIQQQCLAAWKKDYGRRLYTDSEMYARLQDAGLLHQEALDLIDAWKCEYKAPHKQIAARQLCDAAKKGEIDRQQLQEGLRELKFRPKDIRRLVGGCLGPLKAEKAPVKPAPVGGKMPGGKA